MSVNGSWHRVQSAGSADCARHNPVPEHQTEDSGNYNYVKKKGQTPYVKDPTRPASAVSSRPSNSEVDYQQWIDCTAVCLQELAIPEKPKDQSGSSEKQGGDSPADSEFSWPDGSTPHGSQSNSSLAEHLEPHESHSWQDENGKPISLSSVSAETRCKLKKTPGPKRKSITQSDRCPSS